jgi:DNA-binding phage protein
VPGPPMREMSDGERRRLQRAEARIDRAEAELRQARRRWAEVARELGLATVARERGVSRQSVEKRVRKAERG